MSSRSFGRRYRALLVGGSPAGIGTPSDVLAAQSVTVRGRAGYSFWQRYWASFAGLALPVRLEGPARHDDPAVTASEPSPDQRREGTLADGELDTLLSLVADLPFGLTPVSTSAETSAAAASVSIVPDGAATFSVTLRLIPAPGRLLPGLLTVALVADRTHFVARVSPDGIGTFRHVPVATWAFRRIRQLSPRAVPPASQASRAGGGGNSALALPTPVTGSSLAAAGTTRSAVLRIVLPEVILVLHREPGGEFLLEVVDGEPVETPVIVTIRSGAMSGAAQDLVVPVTGKGALARLPGYSPDAPWEASTFSAGQFPGWESKRIALSVRAAANNATRRAWRAVSEFAPAEIRDLIEAELR